MGSLFEPDVRSESTVSGYQQAVQMALARAFPGLMAGSKALMGARQAVLAANLRGGPTDISNIVTGAYRRFDEEVVPRINAAFSGISGALSSRRGTEIRRGAGDLGAQLAGLEANMLEQYRQRQLAASQQVLAHRLAPFGVGAGFATAPTMENIVQPSIGSGLLGVAGMLGGAALGGPFGGALGGWLFGQRP